MAEEGKGEEKESWQQRTRRRARKRLAICRVRLARRFRSPWTWTFVYLVCLVFYLFGALVFGGHVKFANMTPNNVGDFLAGAAAPLAFFWLVWGYHLQREELRLQRKELADTRKELQNQAQQQKRQAEQQEKFASATQQQVSFQLIGNIERTLVERARNFAVMLKKYRSAGHLWEQYEPLTCSVDELLMNVVRDSESALNQKRSIILGNVGGIQLESNYKAMFGELNGAAEKYNRRYEDLEEHIRTIPDEIIRSILIDGILESNYGILYNNLRAFASINDLEQP